MFFVERVNFDLGCSILELVEVLSFFGEFDFLGFIVFKSESEFWGV